METNELMEYISEHLQEVNNDTAERLKRIDEMLFFLNFNRRLTELSEEEKENYFHCHEGFPWTDDMRNTYNKADEKTKNEYVTMWARETYMRRCAWDNYLAGHTNEKPFISKTETQAA